MTPLAIDLFCGLGGWSDGLLAEGFDVVGFDVERHEYGGHRYPGLLVLQDVRTLHGSQFKDAALIVASPPCQEYSYMAMPWTRAKAKAAAIRADATGAALERLNHLFNECFRIQREACEAAGRHVPLVVENVKGAQPWVGRARWSFGSFYLWGDVPALMPIVLKATKQNREVLNRDGHNVILPQVVNRETPGMNWSDKSKRGQDFTRLAGREAVKGKPYETGNKNNGGSWFAIAHNTTRGKGQNPDGRKTSGHQNIRNGHTHTKHLTCPDEHGVKHRGSGAIWFDTGPASLPSSSLRRKAASAMIAKIPLPLSRHIAATFRREIRL
jgi:hypothetical protein